MIDAERHEEFESVRRSIVAWVTATEDVVGAALVGSWARGEPGPDSDIDVVVLTESTGYATSDRWVPIAVGRHGELARTAQWGPLVERRVRLPSGLEVDIGFVDPSWAATDPVDDGTEQVIGGGCRIWHDPAGHFPNLLAAIGP